VIQTDRQHGVGVAGAHPEVIGRPGTRALIVIAWLVTRAAARAVVLPYEVVGPYSTWESDCTEVFQVIVAPLDVRLTFAPLIHVADPVDVEGKNSGSTP